MVPSAKHFNEETREQRAGTFSGSGRGMAKPE